MNSDTHFDPDSTAWRELCRRAEVYLPADLSERVLARVNTVKRHRREIMATMVTLLVCLIGTGFTIGLWQYRQQEQSLTGWQELAAVTQVIDRGL